jgi:hypothetical protein
MIPYTCRVLPLQPECTSVSSEKARTRSRAPPPSLSSGVSRKTSHLRLRSGLLLNRNGGHCTYCSASGRVLGRASLKGGTPHHSLSVTRDGAALLILPIQRVKCGTFLLADTVIDLHQGSQRLSLISTPRSTVLLSASSIQLLVLHPCARPVNSKHGRLNSPMRSDTSVASNRIWPMLHSEARSLFASLHQMLLAR